MCRRWDPNFECIHTNPGVEYPSQSRLVAARDNVPSLENYQAIRSHLKMVTDDLSAVYDAHDIDLIVIPTDSPICSVSAATGKFL